MNGHGNAPMIKNCLALREAAKQGHDDIVQMLLECLACLDPNLTAHRVKRSIGCAIVDAACSGHSSTLNILLESTPSSIWADVGSFDSTQNTRGKKKSQPCHLSYALNAAASGGHVEIVEYLLNLMEENIPNIEHRIYIGQRALLAAARLGYESIARILIVDYDIPVDGYNPYRSHETNRDYNSDRSPMMVATLAG